MYVDDAGGARIGATLGKELANEAATANGGGFAVEGRGAEALLRAVHDVADWLDGQLGRLDALDGDPPLGRTAGALAVGPHVRQAAVDDQGFLTQLRRLRETLAQAERGIRAAMSEYHSVDGLNAAGLAARGSR